MGAPAPKTILLVGNFLSQHGYSRQFIEELAPRLEAAGWQCTFASTLVWRPARFVDMVQLTLRSLRRVSVVHLPVFSGRAFIWAEVVTFLAALARVPVVLSLHGGSLPHFSKRFPRRTRMLLRRAAIVVSPSTYLRDAMHVHHPDIRIVPNPVTLEAYRFRERDRVEPRITWLRGFHAIYNPVMAVRVLALVCAQYPDASLTMYGFDRGDGTREQTEGEARSLGVADSLSLPGGLVKSDVPDALDAHDIFINTTNVDNTPVSVLEAMASGLPVVTTNVGGIPHFLTDERDALLVPPDDALAMAAAVFRLLAEPGLARRLSAEGRRMAEVRDWKTIITAWDALLAEAANRDGAARV